MQRNTHNRYVLTPTWGSFTLLLLSLWLLPMDSAEAAAYRCTDEQGRTSYSEKPCAVDQRVNKIISGIGGGIEYHCELPQKLAEKTAKTMRDGRDSSVVFKQYGGIHTLSPTVISIINYVYQFKLNYQATTERIVSLTKQRCEVGSFGVTDCEVFPSSFVSSAGGCLGSGTAIASYDTSTTSSANDTASSSRYSNSGSADVPPENFERANESTADCRARHRYQIEGIESQLFDTVSSSAENRLRAKQRDLRRSAERC